MGERVMFTCNRGSLIFWMQLFVVTTIFLPLWARSTDECSDLRPVFRGAAEGYEQVLPAHENTDIRAKTISDIIDGHYFVAVSYPYIPLFSPPPLYTSDLCPGDQGNEGRPLYLFIPFWMCCGALATEIHVTPEAVDWLISNPLGWYTRNNDFDGWGGVGNKSQEICSLQQQVEGCPLSKQYNCSSQWLVDMSHPSYNLIMLPLLPAKQDEGESLFPDRTVISVYAIQRQVRLLLRKFTPADIIEPWSCTVESGSGSGLLQMDEAVFCSLVFARNEITGLFKPVTDYEFSLQVRDINDGKLVSEVPLLRLNPANSSEKIALEDNQYFDRYNGPIMVTEVQQATNESSDILRVKALLYDYDLWADRLSVTILKKRADGGCEAFQTTVTETPATTVVDNSGTNTTVGGITSPSFYRLKIALGITTTSVMLVAGLRLVALKFIVTSPKRLPF